MSVIYERRCASARPLSQSSTRAVDGGVEVADVERSSTPSSPAAHLERRDFDSLKRRVLNLPEADRLELYRAVSTSVQVADPPSVAEAQVERRAVAMEILRAAKAELKLDDDGVRDLTMTRFDSLPEATRQGWKAARIARAFGGTWRYAKMALLGERLPMNLQQRQQRIQASQRARFHQDHVEGVALWLDSKPSSESPSAYDAWAANWNANRQPEQLKLAKAVSIKRSKRWDAVLAAAKGETPLPAEKVSAPARAKPERAWTKGNLVEVVSADELPVDDNPAALATRVLDGELLARRIFWTRLARGMGRAEVSSRADLADGNLYMAETGQRSESPVFWTIARIALALEVPLDHFLTPDGRSGVPPARGHMKVLQKS
jgi:hypothetical protein